MDTNDTFTVEGRYFPNNLWAFTFAGILADRMDRPVEVHLNTQRGADHPGEYRRYMRSWHSTAHPSNFVRRHLVKESL